MSELPQSIVIHGTYRSSLALILKNGLSRMSRNHIHLAIGLPEDGNVISGLRLSAEIAILIDINKARAAGIQFFMSKNKVVLSKGLGDSGIIPAEFFHDVIALDGKPFDIKEFQSS
jgi:2'-phosphotransferase